MAQNIKEQDRAQARHDAGVLFFDEITKLSNHLIDSVPLLSLTAPLRAAVYRDGTRKIMNQISELAPLELVEILRDRTQGLKEGIALQVIERFRDKINENIYLALLTPEQQEVMIEVILSRVYLALQHEHAIV